MSSTNQSVTVGAERPWYEVALSCTLTTPPCCVFLFINGTLLLTLRSKAVFCETCRYILLFNLLFADSLQLAQSQIMFLLVACGVRLLYSVCGALVLLVTTLSIASPFTLVLMCVERYVAVCYPLRHAAVVTVTNTGAAVCAVWTFASLKASIHVVLMLGSAREDLRHLRMKNFCNKENLTLDPKSDVYDKVFSYSLCVFAALAFAFSYVGVTAAARSASTDKASVKKARNTLLLHLVQLGLSLSETVHNPLMLFIYQSTERAIANRVRTVIYICVIILPRCLSSLIYGLRDPTIRPVFMFRLSCQWRRPPSLSGVSAEASAGVLVRASM